MEGSVQISFIRKGTASSLRREGRRGPARPPRSPWQFSSAHTSDRSGRPRRSPRAGRRSTFGLLLLLHPCSFLLRFVTKVSPQSITRTGIRGGADHRFEVFSRAIDKVLPDRKSRVQLGAQRTTPRFSTFPFTQIAFLAVRCAGERRRFPARRGRGFGQPLWARLCGGLRRR